MVYAAIATVLSLLVILFTFLSTQAKERENKDAEDKLKSSVKEVSDSLGESLKKTSEVIENINSLGDSLNLVKKDLKGQVKLMESSIDEAKRFQRLIDEQNERDRKRFDLESAKIVSYSSNIEFVPINKDSAEYVFRHRFINEGQRNGTLLSIKSMLLLTDNQFNIKKEIFIYQNDPNVFIAGKGTKNQGIYDYWSTVKFEKESLKNGSDYMIYIVRYTYQDEALQKVIEEESAHHWWGAASQDFTFSTLSSIHRPKFLEYFKKEFDK